MSVDNENFLCMELDRANDRITGLTMELELAKVELGRALDNAKRANAWANEVDQAVNRADTIIKELATQRDHYATLSTNYGKALDHIYAVIGQTAQRSREVIDAGSLESRREDGSEAPSGEVQSSDSGVVADHGNEVELQLEDLVCSNAS